MCCSACPQTQEAAARSCCQWLWSDFLQGFRYGPDTRHQWPLNGRLHEKGGWDMDEMLFMKA